MHVYTNFAPKSKRQYSFCTSGTFCYGGQEIEKRFSLKVILGKGPTRDTPNYVEVTAVIARSAATHDVAIPSGIRKLPRPLPYVLLP